MGILFVKKKFAQKTISLLLILSLLMTYFTGLKIVKATSGNWLDYADNTWNAMTIETEEQFARFAQMVRDGNNFSRQTVTLNANLDLSDHYWRSIGKEDFYFAGTFDGNNKIISGLTMSEADLSDDVGEYALFGVLSTSTTIKNLHIQSPTISANQGNSHAAAITTYVQPGGTIDNCSVLSGTISAGNNGYAGGIAALNTGKIINSYVSGTTISTQGQYAGGLTATTQISGGFEAEIANSYVNHVSVINNNDGSGAYDPVAGALTGHLRGDIVNSYATYNNVTLSNGTKIGALVGHFNSGAISHSYAGTTSSKTLGLVGVSDSSAITTNSSLFEESNGNLNGDISYNGETYTTLLEALSAIAKNESSYKGWANTTLPSFGTKTTTSLAVPDGAQDQGVGFDLVATLLNESSVGISAKVVKFYEVAGDTTTNLGEGNTNAQGKAMLTIAPNVAGTKTYFAKFDGDASYGLSTSTQKTVEIVTPLPTTNWSDEANRDTTWDGGLIENEADFAQFAYRVNNGENFEGVAISLNADLDLSAHLWTPIAENTSNKFSGTFDGQNKKINGLIINNSSNAGLFGYVDSGEIKNLGIISPNIKGNVSAALAVDTKNDSVIDNCYVSGGTVSGGFQVGGLVAVINGGTLTNSYTENVEVKGEGAQLYHTIGSLVGNIGRSGIVKNSYAKGGSVMSTATSADFDVYVGGLVGNVGGTVENCYTAVPTVISSNQEAIMGGITGSKESVGQINNSYWLYEGVDGVNKGAGVGTLSNTNTSFLLNGAFNNSVNVGSVSADGLFSALGEWYTQKVLEDSSLNPWVLGTDYPVFGTATNLSLSTTATDIKVNDRFTVSATLKDKNDTPLQGKTILLYKVLDSGITGIGDATTNANGVATFSLSEAVDGEAKYRALFLGDSTYAKANSTDFAVTILPPTHWSALRDTTWTGGNVENGADLAQLAHLVNFGNDFRGQTVTLNASLDLSAYTWTPIGEGDSPGGSRAFEGVFDGNNNTITGLKVEGVNYQGLFGDLGEDGRIVNLGLIEPNVIGKSSVGALVGRSVHLSAVVDNCYVSGGTIKGQFNVGGLIGSLRGIVRNSYSKDVTVTSDTLDGPNLSLGGLVGNTAGGSSVIENCFAKDVTINSTVITANQHCGGLIGGMDGGNISNSYANVKSISVDNGAKVGGLIGNLSFGEVKYSYWLYDGNSGMELGVGSGSLGSTNDSFNASGRLSNLGIEVLEALNSWVEQNPSDIYKYWHNSTAPEFGIATSLTLGLNQLNSPVIGQNFNFAVRLMDKDSSGLVNKEIKIYQVITDDTGEKEVEIGSVYTEADGWDILVNDVSNPVTGADYSLGEKVFRAKFEGDKDYGSSTQDLRFSIVKKTPVISFTNSAQSENYDGTEKNFNENNVNKDGSTGTVTFAYFAQATGGTALGFVPINAGTYYVEASISETDNYIGATTSTRATLTINKASTTIDWVNTNIRVLNTGSPTVFQESWVTKGAGDGTISFSYYASPTGGSPIVGDIVTGGTYYLEATVNEGTNHNQATTATRAVLTVVKPDTSLWGNEENVQGITQYVDSDGMTSVPVTDNMVWLNENEGSTNAWIGIDNSGNEFEFGSRFYGKLISKENNPVEFEQHFNNMDNNTLINQDRTWIIVVGVINPAGVEYTDFANPISLYVQLGDGWDISEFKATFVSESTDENVELSYVENQAHPQGTANFAKLTLNHFSVYSIYELVRVEPNPPVNPTPGNDSASESGISPSGGSANTSDNTILPWVILILAVSFGGFVISRKVLKKKLKSE